MYNGMEKRGRRKTRDEEIWLVARGGIQSKETHEVMAQKF